MRRRHVLASSLTALTALAGCSGYMDENGTNSPTASPTATPTPSDTPTPTATPTEEPVTPTGPPSDEVIEDGPMEWMPDDFPDEWLLHTDDDWVLRRRLFERPNTDEIADWTPEFALSEEFIHDPSQQAFAGAVNASYVPPIKGIVASKWALSSNHSGNSADLVAEVRNWFAEWFRSSGVDVINTQRTHPTTFGLESGRRGGRARFGAVGDTAHLGIEFEATIEGESHIVERVTYEAEVILLGLIDSENQIGYLLGSGWPTTDTLTLHTTGNEEIDVSATVAADLWEMQDRMVPVLDEFDYTLEE